METLLIMRIVPKLLIVSKSSGVWIFLWTSETMRKELTVMLVTANGVRSISIVQSRCPGKDYLKMICP